MEIGQGGAQQGGAQFTSEPGQLLDGLGGRLPGFRVPLAYQRHDHLLDHARLPVDGTLIGPQVARLDPVAGEGRCQLGDDGGLLAVVGDAADQFRGDETEPLEVANRLDVDAGLVGQLL